MTNLTSPSQYPPMIEVTIRLPKGSSQTESHWLIDPSELDRLERLIAAMDQEVLEGLEYSRSRSGHLLVRRTLGNKTRSDHFDQFQGLLSPVELCPDLLVPADARCQLREFRLSFVREQLKLGQGSDLLVLLPDTTKDGISEIRFQPDFLPLTNLVTYRVPRTIVLEPEAFFSSHFAPITFEEEEKSDTVTKENGPQEETPTPRSSSVKLKKKNVFSSAHHAEYEDGKGAPFRASVFFARTAVFEKPAPELGKKWYCSIAETQDAAPLKVAGRVRKICSIATVSIDDIKILTAAFQYSSQDGHVRDFLEPLLPEAARIWWSNTHLLSPAEIVAGALAIDQLCGGDLTCIAQAHRVLKARFEMSAPAESSVREIAESIGKEMADAMTDAAQIKITDRKKIDTNLFLELAGEIWGAVCNSFLMPSERRILASRKPLQQSYLAAFAERMDQVGQHGFMQNQAFKNHPYTRPSFPDALFSSDALVFLHYLNSSVWQSETRTSSNWLERFSHVARGMQGKDAVGFPKSLHLMKDLIKETIDAFADDAKFDEWFAKVAQNHQTKWNEFIWEELLKMGLSISEIRQKRERADQILTVLQKGTKSSSVDTIFLPGIDTFAILEGRMRQSTVRVLADLYKTDSCLSAFFQAYLGEPVEPAVWSAVLEKLTLTGDSTESWWAPTAYHYLNAMAFTGGPSALVQAVQALAPSLLHLARNSCGFNGPAAPPALWLIEHIAHLLCRAHTRTPPPETAGQEDYRLLFVLNNRLQVELRRMDAFVSRSTSS